jgi:hypothetical protein
MEAAHVELPAGLLSPNENQHAALAGIHPYLFLLK